MLQYLWDGSAKEEGVPAAACSAGQPFQRDKTEVTLPSTGTTIKVMPSDAETAFGID